MKILLINPHFWGQHPPLGLGFLASYVKKYAGFPVEFKIADELAWQDPIREAQKFQPDIIGITVVTPTAPRAAALIRELKRTHSGPILVGGPHITVRPKAVIELGATAGVVGEGEVTLLEVVWNFQMTGRVATAKIAGLAYPDENGKLVQTEERELIKDLNEIPPIDRSLFDMKHYLRPGRISHGLYGKGASVMVSRGCPLGKCNFCSSYLLWKNRIRFFSPQRVAEEIDQLVNYYGVNFVFSLDDNFTTNVKWLEDLKRELEQRGLLRKFYFDCESLSFVLDERRVKLLVEIGCRRVEFGFESGCQKTLDKLKCGKIKLEQNDAALRLCQKYNLPTVGNVIFGYYDETAADMAESMQWYRDRNIDYVQAHVYTPFPGTGAWQEGIERGIITDNITNWDIFATGSAKENIYVNQCQDKETFFRAVRTFEVEMEPRGKIQVFEQRLNWMERMTLFSAITLETRGVLVADNPETIKKLLRWRQGYSFRWFSCVWQRLTYLLEKIQSGKRHELWRTLKRKLRIVKQPGKNVDAV